ncbi:MAG: hypothetical protein AAGB48_00930 [Planctomycetota bacterium]
MASSPGPVLPATISGRVRSMPMAFASASAASLDGSSEAASHFIDPVTRTDRDPRARKRSA